MLSLREAIAAANLQPVNGQQQINFAAALNGGIIELQKQLPTFTNNIYINGPGSGQMTVERDAQFGDFRLFAVDTGSVSTIAGITLQNGALTGSEPGGAAIYSKGNLTVTSCTFWNNSAGGTGAAEGGAIYAINGSLDVNDSSFMNNEAEWGGAICVGNSVPLRMTNTYVGANTASVSGGGICAEGAPSGSTQTVILDNVSLVSNTAAYNGGGIFCSDGTYLTLTGGTLIQNNAASDLTSGKGGGVYITGNRSTIDYENVTIEFNTAAYGNGVYRGGFASRVDGTPGVTFDGANSEYTGQ